MIEKYDFKKEYKNLYSSRQKPILIDVPPLNYIMIDGIGKPTGENYQNAMQILYALTYTIKMSKKGDKHIKGYYEYVIPPLEGLWYLDNGKLDFNVSKDKWLWTSMIAQPDFVNEDIFNWALDECKNKKPNLDFSKARFETFAEGLCVQSMHIGSYDDELRTIAKIEKYMDENKLTNVTSNIRKHHEIYLSDPRRTSPEKLRTILRFPVEKTSF
ncbi:MAG: GyrI-like domain-containing protein [Terrisporobacter othiniensis]|uniref:GyrI-like domain-containing protein n=1 Tax=Terrisporobacter petrolearius TaxID=1460447 RepID=UPI0008E049DD|nr:GyrI-like domain-containing protein [Terrisporobacter petrolearius]MBN9646319.1 GyrI-like domain-containing protein [Terrisporobacter glycolicus]MDU4859732.1 GyrI-like domain-containing protein [Terrisporobacter othiniensis]MDU6994099.1 GyrI-like domain-containing protein [Terrisporobacter othiniensis]UPA29364.1 GyrI-like domain-containing protein [Terrisporobacter glycolicus]SFJ06219.1 hypothetical protein SAMN02910355_0836 [Terrisporobacter glycolicus]